MDSMAAKYVQLRKTLEEKGYFQRTPWYYTVRIIATTAFFAISYGILLFSNTWWLTLIGIFTTAFFTVQFGFLGHEAGHGAITKNKNLQYILGQFSMSVINGVGYSHWKERHDTHHGKSNHEEEDPDLKNMVFFAFTTRKAMTHKGWKKLTTMYQSILLPIFAFFSVISLRVTAVTEMFTHSAKKRIADTPFILLHFAMWFLLPLPFIGFWNALLLYALTSLPVGFYFGMVFIPNHFGMRVVTDDDDLDFMTQQVETSRDIKLPRFLDWTFGGLNYQIEHHLFPTMSHKYLANAKKIVKEFCQEHKISYHEVGFARTYAEVIKYMHKVGMSLKQLRKMVDHSMFD